MRLGGCPGWSESSLGAQSLCWFCYVAAHRDGFNSCRGFHLISDEDYSFNPHWSVRTNISWRTYVCGKVWVYVRNKCYLVLKRRFYHSFTLHAKNKENWKCRVVLFMFRLTKYEPRHDKTNKMAVRPAKTQLSLRIRPVWSESSLSARRKPGFLATHWAHSEDSDQTGRMPRLNWVCAGRTLILFVLSCRGSIINLPI